MDDKFLLQEGCIELSMKMMCALQVNLQRQRDFLPIRLRRMLKLRTTTKLRFVETNTGMGCSVYGIIHPEQVLCTTRQEVCRYQKDSFFHCAVVFHDFKHFHVDETQSSSTYNHHFTITESST